MSQYKTSRNYVPAIPDDILSPPPDPQPEPPLVRNAVSSEAAWLISTLAVVLMTIVLIVAMLIDGSTSREAVSQGVKFFLGAIALISLVLSGALTDMFRGWQHEKTERMRVNAYADLGEQVIEWRMKAEENRRLELERDALPATLSRRLAALETELLERSLAIDGAARGARGSTFVTPYSNHKGGAFAAETQPPMDTTAQEAIRWVATNLYTETGDINRAHVQLDGNPDARGRIHDIRVIGSARDSGSPDALRWLLDRGVLEKRPGGYKLNVRAYPRREDLRYVR